MSSGWTDLLYLSPFLSYLLPLGFLAIYSPSLSFLCCEIRMTLALASWVCYKDEISQPISWCIRKKLLGYCYHYSFIGSLFQTPNLTLCCLLIALMPFLQTGSSSSTSTWLPLAHSVVNSCHVVSCSSEDLCGLLISNSPCIAIPSLPCLTFSSQHTSAPDIVQSSFIY